MIPTFSSGRLSWNTGERPVIRALRLKYVCWGVLSPGAEMSQNSAIFVKGSLAQSREEKLKFTNTFRWESPSIFTNWDLQLFSYLRAWLSRFRLAGSFLSGKYRQQTNKIDDDSCLPLFGYAVDRETSVSWGKSRDFIAPWRPRVFHISSKRTR